MAMNYEIEVDPKVFNEAYLPHLNNYSRIQIFYGGSSSGKSVFLAQRDIIDVMRGKRNFLVLRQVGRTLRGSVIQEIVKTIRQWNLQNLFAINKTDGTITCENGYQIVFAGLDDVEKLKSMTPAKGVFTDIRIEEATETEFSSIKQLLKRQRGGEEDIPKRLVLSFNPILQSHWIYDEYFRKVDNQENYQTDSLSILKTWYIHNRFLTPEDIRDLENETDPYYHNVYTLGNWGVLGNVIFKNWSVEDLLPMRDQFTNHKHGLDFGFSSDPSALVVTHYDKHNKTIYIYDEVYETGLTNDVLATIVKEKIGKQPVVCDSAEPKSIQELRAHGVLALPARKGKDSVLYGIQWLQQQKIVIDTHCINARNEFSQHKWKEDAGGNPLPVPVGKNDHLIAATRYGYEDEAIKPAVEVYDSPI